MKLRSLEIKLQPSYAANAGKYLAEIEYETGSKDSVKLVLDPGISQDLLAYIGPVIATFATRSAQELQRSILASVQEAKQLPEIAISAQEIPV